MKKNVNFYRLLKEQILEDSAKLSAHKNKYQTNKVPYAKSKLLIKNRNVKQKIT